MDARDREKGRSMVELLNSVTERMRRLEGNSDLPFEPKQAMRVLQQDAASNLEGNMDRNNPFDSVWSTSTDSGHDVASKEGYFNAPTMVNATTSGHSNINLENTSRSDTCVGGLDNATGPDVVSKEGMVNTSTSGLNVIGSDKYEVRSFANVLNPERVSRKVNFRPLVNENRIDNHDTVLPKAAMEGVFDRYDNTLVGFFVGKNVAFHLVKSYVSNTWGKFGFQKLMKNDDGVFLFKFDSKEGVENVLQRGPWIIRNSPLILTKWTPDVLLSKSEVTRVPVWIKLHNVPLLAYSEDGLSLIATQVGKPIMLDAFTSSMCVDSWGRISFARALVELSSESGLKHVVTMAIPNKDDSGFTTASIKVEYEWKPPQCTECKVFGHVTACCPKCIKEQTDVPPTSNVEEHDEGFKVVQNRNAKPNGTKMTGGINLGKGPRFAPRKQVYVAKTKTPTAASVNAKGTPITTSNSFGTLEVEDDTSIPSTVVDSTTDTMKTRKSSVSTKEAGIDGYRGKDSRIDIGEASKPSETGTSSATKVSNPFSKVGNVTCSDSEDDEVLETDNPMASFLASGGGGGI